MLATLPTVSVLVHWARGQLATEEVEVRRKERTKLARFLEIVTVLDEDVRYVVVP